MADGPFLYRDIYAGTAYFVGQEIVYYQGQPAWSMSYDGGVIPEICDRGEIDRIYTFLRMALRKVPAEQPYRGPHLFGDGRYVYENRCQASADCFLGHEIITHNQKKVYELHYRGGFLR